MQLAALAAVRWGRRLRTILQDLSDRDALHLYELAGLKPAGLDEGLPRGLAGNAARLRASAFGRPILFATFTGEDEVGPIERSVGSRSSFASSGGVTPTVIRVRC